MIRIVVPGEPKAMQTGSVVKLPDGRRIPIRRHPEFRNLVKLAAQAVQPPQPFEGPVTMRMYIHRVKPKSARKRDQYPTTRPDIDNYVKASDALNGIIYKDDAQIVDLHVVKLYSLAPGLVIEVAVLGA